MVTRQPATLILISTLSLTTNPLPLLWLHAVSFVFDSGLVPGGDPPRLPPYRLNPGSLPSLPEGPSKHPMPSSSSQAFTLSPRSFPLPLPVRVGLFLTQSQFRWLLGHNLQQLPRLRTVLAFPSNPHCYHQPFRSSPPHYLQEPQPTTSSG